MPNKITTDFLLKARETKREHKEVFKLLNKQTNNQTRNLTFAKLSFITEIKDIPW